MPFADEYVVSAHPPLPLHSEVPRPWALDTYSTGKFSHVFVFYVISVAVLVGSKPYQELVAINV